MIKLAKGEVLCREAKDTPHQVQDKLHPDFASAIGKPISVQFPNLTQAFPQTTETIENQFSPLALIYKLRDSGDYGVRGQFDGEHINLVLRPQPKFCPPDRPDFELNHQMLSPRWRELYRYFDAFGIQSDKSVSRTTLGLPTEYAGRMDEEQYRRIIPIYFSEKNIDKKALTDFCLRIGLKHTYPNGRAGELRCWCLSYSGDSLWISETDSEHNVYCVVDGDFNNEIHLDDPDSILDNYMATTVINPTNARFVGI